MTPFDEATEFIRSFDCSSADTMAKLVLSIAESDAAFGFRECVTRFDSERMDLACRLVEYFREHGHDQNITENAWEIRQMYPGLYEMGIVASKAGQRHYDLHPYQRKTE